MGLGIPLAAALGILFGVLMDNIGLGIAIGAGVGVVFGAGLSRAKTKDKKPDA